MSKKIIVDAGHGGIDSGAIGNNLLEKDLTLQASNYLYNRLQELGIPSKMTRTTDEYLPKEQRIERVLSLYQNDPNTILVSNHINAGGGEGAEVVYSLKNAPVLANLILDNIGEAGQIKRKAYQRRLPENPNKDYYYILRETGNTEPVLIEYGFIDSVKDAEKLKNNLNDYVEGVVKAIAEYAGYPYTPPQQELAKESYSVQKGDTLYSIAKKVNIPIDEIKKINQLENDVLSIGQILYLTSPIKDNLYTVQKGDTLYSIAKKYQTTPQKIIEWNSLKNDVLMIGQELQVKENNMQELIPAKDNTTEYIVQKGDSLWKIANKYNITVKELIEMNELSDLILQIGQVLIVPNEEEILDDKEYIVQKGDTLWSIAKKLEIDVNELKKLNNLDNNLISIGQVIKKK